MVRLPLQDEPRLDYLPSLRRIPDEIDPGLRSDISLLVNGKKPWPLFLCGPPGVGKTCAALCLIDRCYRKDYIVQRPAEIYGGKMTDFYVQDMPSGVYQTAQEICDALFSEFGKKGKSITEATWKRWTEARLAVLDEIGAREKVGDFVYNTTKQLLDVRAGKPLIVISNLDLKALTVLYDDRLTSRLASGTVVKLQGDDRRLR